MVYLIRYQAALLVRSHRWVAPSLVYAVLVVMVSSAGEPLSDGLDWSAAMLVPAVAWLTRSMLTVEPAAARACVSAAIGPCRAHLAALVVALTSGIVFALGGAGFELARLHDPHSLAVRLSVLLSGLAAAGVCLFVGASVGTLCNPPLVRRPAIGILGTCGAVVLALASDVSPANAALKGIGSAPQGSSWLPGLPIAVAAVLMAASWTLSTLVAARRGG